MNGSLDLTPKRLGAWIVNTSKHLVNFAPTSIGLSSFENIFFAGKCGSLLIKLSADEPEQLNHARVKAHAQVCGISGAELPTYLQTLKAHGCLDWNSTASIYEVLPFTRERVLETASAIFEGSVDATQEERALPYLLEFCLIRPRLESEAKELLSKLLPEKLIEQLINLVVQFELLGVNVVLDRLERLFYNEYQFGEEAAVRIGTAIAALDRQKQEELNALLEEVAQRPGVPPESIKISPATRDFAIGLGLVEESEVTSPAGDAKFLTMPRMPIPSVGKEVANIDDDIFHHTKMLLSSLRFGELRSYTTRGKIQNPYVLVKALLDRDRIGPCTAIGQDYIILEMEGVIKTERATYKPGEQFYMELRRREPAEIVLNLLDSGSRSVVGAGSISKELELPMHYTGPEVARPVAARKTTKTDAESMRRFLEVLRT